VTGYPATGGSQEEVASYYEKELNAHGWKVKQHSRARRLPVMVFVMLRATGPTPEVWRSKPKCTKTNESHGDIFATLDYCEDYVPAAS
jgi:hypothetical protein